MRFPLTLRFKFFSFTSEIIVTGPDGEVVMYVKQKMFKLKEDITVFADEDQQTPRYRIQADRVIDFSARYHFTDAQGRAIGSVKRQGGRSLWRAYYEIFDAGDRPVMTLQEERPWVRVVEALAAEIPVVGYAVDYFLNPTYLVTHENGTPVLRLKKLPSLLERKFEIEQVSPASEETETQAVLSALMMVLLERDRG